MVKFLAIIFFASGCRYADAVMYPIKVSAERNMVSTSTEPEALAGWPLEAVSSRRSHISGRNNIALKATIAEFSADTVEILLYISSTTKSTTDPRRLYVSLNSGNGWQDVSKFKVGKVVNHTYNYGVSVPVTVNAGMLRFSDGSTARFTTTKRGTVRRKEDYFSRSSKLTFRLEEAPKGESIKLRLRDLGVEIDMSWNTKGAEL